MASPMGCSCTTVSGCDFRVAMLSLFFSKSLITTMVPLSASRSRVSFSVAFLGMKVWLRVSRVRFMLPSTLTTLMLCPSGWAML